MAAKLILSMDGSVIKEYTLNKERTTIGRKPHNDIVIDNLAVSGEHAVILTMQNDSFLEDLDSTNGVMVNGVQIKKHFLQNNDVIEIGKYKLKYMGRQQSQMQAEEADFEKTMVLRGPAKAQKPGVSPTALSYENTGRFEAASGKTGKFEIAGGKTGKFEIANEKTGKFEIANEKTGKFETTNLQMEISRPLTSQGGQPVPGAPLAAVQILSGPNIGKELELVKNLTTLGKPGVQVAVLTRRPHGYFITHVEGANYPVLNGKVLDEHPHQLNDHDIIELAGIKMEFYIKEQ